MSLVFAALSPHPPILMPEIGKDHLKKIQQTKDAMKALEQGLYAAKPDTIMVISHQGEVMDDSFNINLNSDYTANFQDFGDFGIKLNFKSDYMSIQNIRASDETQGKVPIVLSSNENLEHGFSVPLFYLTQHLKNVPIIPISTSGLDSQKHFEFGEFLYDQISQLDKRVAVIASSDLSHKLTKDAPDGFSKNAVEFDDNLLELIKNKNAKGILDIKDKEAVEVGAYGMRPIATLFGVLSSVNYKPEVLSHEGPFGVGYAVVNFELQ